MDLKIFSRPELQRKIKYEIVSDITLYLEKNPLSSLKDKVAILESENESLRRQTASAEKTMPPARVFASEKVQNFCQHKIF